MFECSYGETRLTDYWTVSDIVRPTPPRIVTADGLTGGDGDVLMGSRYGSYSVSFSIWAFATYEDQPEEIARIAHAFDSAEPQRLFFSDELNRYRMALPDGAPTVDRYIDSVRVAMSLLVPSPALYGKHIALHVPSGGKITFCVSGTYPTAPYIAAPSAVRSSLSDTWGLRLDDSDVIKVPLSSSSARQISLDCEKRECIVSGSPALPTLDSDWFQLTPGIHELVNHQGFGACTIEWDERWL